MVPDSAAGLIDIALHHWVKHCVMLLVGRYAFVCYVFVEVTQTSQQVAERAPSLGCFPTVQSAFSTCFHSDLILLLHSLLFPSSMLPIPPVALSAPLLGCTISTAIEACAIFHKAKIKYNFEPITCCLWECWNSTGLGLLLLLHASQGVSNLVQVPVIILEEIISFKWRYIL